MNTFIIEILDIANIYENNYLKKQYYLENKCYYLKK